jgi:hypothetical protein
MDMYRTYRYSPRLRSCHRSKCLPSPTVRVTGSNVPIQEEPARLHPLDPVRKCAVLTAGADKHVELVRKAWRTGRQKGPARFNPVNLLYMCAMPARWSSTVRQCCQMRGEGEGSKLSADLASTYGQEDRASLLIQCMASWLVGWLQPVDRPVAWEVEPDLLFQLTAAAVGQLTSRPTRSFLFLHHMHLVIIEPGKEYYQYCPTITKEG